MILLIVRPSPTLPPTLVNVYLIRDQLQARECRAVRMMLQSSLRLKHLWALPGPSRLGMVTSTPDFGDG